MAVIKLEIMTAYFPWVGWIQSKIACDSSSPSTISVILLLFWQFEQSKLNFEITISDLNKTWTIFYLDSIQLKSIVSFSFVVINVHMVYLAAYLFSVTHLAWLKPAIVGPKAFRMWMDIIFEKATWAHKMVHRMMYSIKVTLSIMF